MRVPEIMKPDHWQRIGAERIAEPGYVPPVQAPMPPLGRGILEPTPMPGLPELAGHDGPIVRGIAAHQARAATTMPRMPIPRGAA